jgi:beta-phosphoglucomutase-like phosphatase (HAD superfamily)
VVIFDCNGVLVDSEPLATSVVSQEFMRAGFALTPDIGARYFTGRRRRSRNRGRGQAAQGLRREGHHRNSAPVPCRIARNRACRPRPVMAAGTELRGLRLPLDRIRVALEATDLIRYFEPYLYSGNDVRYSKRAPDLFLHVARKMYVEPDKCIVVLDSPVGVAASVAAGMMVIGFAGAATPAVISTRTCN